MKLFIGLVGEKGSGKDTFAENFIDICSSHSVKRYRSSEILADTLCLWNLEKTRHNLQQLAIVMDQGFGVGTLTKAIQSHVQRETADIVIFDAVRWQSDLAMTRAFPLNMLVYITIDSKTRFIRTKERKQKVGEATTTYDQFLEDEKIATETEIGKIGALADITLENSGSIEQFRAAIAEFYQQKVKMALMRLQ